MMRRYSQLRAFVLGILVLSITNGCSENVAENSVKVGYLVNPTDTNIEYKCGEKKASLKSNGKFNCSSFPITFYSNNSELGSISSIHGDGYVFPQDIEMQERAEVKFMRVASR